MALKDAARAVLRYLKLPMAARLEMRNDRRAKIPIKEDPFNVLTACIDWLCVAQDSSMSRDGGVARDFSLLRGWATSYPETTGYIVPTMLECAAVLERPDLASRAYRMLEWLVSIQSPGGGFQGGKVDAPVKRPVTFNTGQILLGLAAGAERRPEYLEPMRRAADWLVDTQDPDGCWRRYPTPFAKPGEKAYETHVSWGLFEAAKVVPSSGYAETALANIYWAIGRQTENGWVEDCCLDDPRRPLTHTLGYYLRGLIEAYRFSKRQEILTASQLTADGLLSGLHANGKLPGRFASDWSPCVDWVCLTGAAQVAHCWLMLYEETGEPKYLHAGRAANQYVRSTVRLDGDPQIRGGVKGSFPVDGDYGEFQYLNWAVKFLIDSTLLEHSIQTSDIDSNGAV